MEEAKQLDFESPREKQYSGCGTLEGEDKIMYQCKNHQLLIGISCKQKFHSSCDILTGPILDDVLKEIEKLRDECIEMEQFIFKYHLKGFYPTIEQDMQEILEDINEMINSLFVDNPSFEEYYNFHELREYVDKIATIKEKLSTGIISRVNLHQGIHLYLESDEYTLESLSSAISHNHAFISRSFR